MSSYEYHQLLKFLYFEGYADSYEEAENLLEEISDEEFEELLERKYDYNEPLPGSGETPRKKSERKQQYHGASYLLGGRQKPRPGRNDPGQDSHFSRGSTIDTVIQSMDAGEEPHKDPAWKNTIAARRRPRASYEVPNERPGGLRAGNTTAARVDDQGRVRSHRAVTRVNKEELELSEREWGDDERDSSETREHNKIIQTPEFQQRFKRDLEFWKKRNAQAVSRERLKRKNATPQRVNPNTGEKTPVFESIVEYLFVKGYADTIENAEVMAESISEDWVNEILESRGQDLRDKYGLKPGQASAELARRSHKKIEDDETTPDDPLDKPYQNLHDRASNRAQGKPNAEFGIRSRGGGAGSGSERDRGSKGERFASFTQGERTSPNMTTDERKRAHRR